MMVGNNLKDTQLQQIVDKTILFADRDEDGKINFEEFCSVSKYISLWKNKKSHVRQLKYLARMRAFHIPEILYMNVSF